MGRGARPPSASVIAARRRAPVQSLLGLLARRVASALRGALRNLRACCTFPSRARCRAVPFHSCPGDSARLPPPSQPTIRPDMGCGRGLCTADKIFIFINLLFAVSASKFQPKHDLKLANFQHFWEHLCPRRATVSLSG